MFGDLSPRISAGGVRRKLPVPLPARSGGTGVKASAPANGQLAIGNGTGFSLATLTQGSNVTITNGPGSITVATAGGMTIGNAVSGGGANRVLFEDASQNLSADAAFTFNGATLVATALGIGSGDFSVDAGGNTVVAGTLHVFGTCTFDHRIDLTAGDLNVQTGNAIINGTLSAAGTAFTVDLSGNVACANNVNVGSLTGPSELILLRNTIGTAAALQFYEWGSDPSAPGSGKAILYAKDNGGKVTLYAIFPSGSPVVIAAEP